jgi:predicted flap endonuclease-1-like 5' DNA nuclease
MEPIGSFNTSATAGATANVPGTVSTPAATTPQNTGDTQPANDTVELTGTALAKSLELSGQTPAQIAAHMGLDVQTVDSYLGIQATTTATPATYSAPQVIKMTAETSATPQSNN